MVLSAEFQSEGMVQLVPEVRKILAGCPTTSVQDPGFVAL